MSWWCHKSVWPNTVWLYSSTVQGEEQTETLKRGKSELVYHMQLPYIKAKLYSDLMSALYYNFCPLWSKCDLKNNITKHVHESWIITIQVVNWPSLQIFFHQIILIIFQPRVNILRTEHFLDHMSWQLHSNNKSIVTRTARVRTLHFLPWKFKIIKTSEIIFSSLCGRLKTDSRSRHSASLCGRNKWKESKRVSACYTRC